MVIERLRWSLRRAALSACAGLVCGALFGALCGWLVGTVAGYAGGMTLLDEMFAGDPGGRQELLDSLAELGDLSDPVVATDLFAGLLGILGAALFAALMGAVFGALFALVGGLTGSEVETRVAPNQGVRRSARRASQVGVAALLLFGLPWGPISWQPQSPLIALWDGLSFGLTLGLPCALAFGGYACLSHLALRLVLWRAGALPLRCIPFLDFAAERVLLRKVGGGYIFVHRLLQEHFAALEAGPRALTPPTD